jgi:rod shape-determining protein MreC
MRKAGILILVFLTISLLLVIVDRVAGLGLLKGALAWLSAPAEEQLHGGANQGVNPLDCWQEAEQLRQENARLEELVAYLTTENRRYEEIKRENEELRQLLGLRERYPALDLLYAEVIGRDPTGLRQVVRIGWQTAAGDEVTVREGMPVISPAGLVGRVIQVYPNAADVLLITDVSSSVSAVVQNDDRPTGIVDGRWQEGSRLAMRYLPQGSVVHEGDWVVTSGLQMAPFQEESFPPAIPIGRILKVETIADLHQQVELIPAVDFDHLDKVMIVIGTR